MKASQVGRALSAIDKRGMLLTYPVQNRAEPRALWHELHPRTPMKWSWDEDADPRVAEMWHLRESLARSRKVVYTKWLGGRATFFSRELFKAMLAKLRTDFDLEAGLSSESLTLLELLKENSPQSSRALREAADLAGRYLETAFTRAARALWERLLIVGFGEVEAGGFPSLAVGATEVLFEDLWQDAADYSPEDEARIALAVKDSASFARAWRRLRSRLAEVPRTD